MSIQAFSFPVPETRFVQAGQQVFKFKIRRGDISRQDYASLFYLFNIKYAIIFWISLRFLLLPLKYSLPFAIRKPTKRGNFSRNSLSDFDIVFYSVHEEEMMYGALVSEELEVF